MSLYQGSNCCHEHFGLNRLGEIGICSAFQKRTTRPLVVDKCRRELQYRNVARTRVGLKASTNLITQNVGQLHVEQDGWKEFCFQPVPAPQLPCSRFGSRRSQHVFKGVRNGIAVRGSIIHDKNHALSRCQVPTPVVSSKSSNP